MFALGTIARCSDLTDEHIRETLAAARSLSETGPRERAMALLKHMVEIARPDTGATRILVLLARMARRDWIEGDLIVRVIGDHELSVLELFVDDGASRERIAGPLRLDVPLDEFVSFVPNNARELLPLVATERTIRRLELRGVRDLRAQQRKASISAFAVELKDGLGHATKQTPEIPTQDSDEPARPKK